MAGVKTTLDQIQVKFKQLIDQIEDPQLALKTIGEILTNNTQARLQKGVDINGQPFKPLAALTVARKKSNKDKILIESGDLYRELHYQLSNGGKSLEFGSDRIYAALMQFGAKQGGFGRNRRNTPIPWGDVPARPFIGVTEQDATEILEALTDMIEEGL